MVRMTKHGVAGYRTHKCRCKVCTKAYKRHLELKRNARVTTGRLPSVTNTLQHDTMTREDYNRLRMADVFSPRKVRGMEWLQ
jgi:hypothetical protein